MTVNNYCFIFKVLNKITSFSCQFETYDFDNHYHIFVLIISQLPEACSLINQFLKILSSSISDSVQLLSHVQLLATPWTAACLVYRQLPESIQTDVPWVDDAIQPAHPLSSTSPPTFNLSQHQGLFKWVSSLHQVAKVLEFQLQHQSFQWIFRTDFL